MSSRPLTQDEWRDSIRVPSSDDLVLILKEMDRIQKERIKLNEERRSLMVETFRLSMEAQ